jgi:hypothetical protein
MWLFNKLKNISYEVFGKNICLPYEIPLIAFKDIIKNRSEGYLLVKVFSYLSKS